MTGGWSKIQLKQEVLVKNKISGMCVCVCVCVYRSVTAAHSPGVWVSATWPWCGCHQMHCGPDQSRPSALLEFHLGCISDRRVIKAAINAWPFPLPLSWGPTGQEWTLYTRQRGEKMSKNHQDNGFSSFPVASDLKERKKNQRDAAGT